MKIQTFSILVGSQACNACCPFCVSQMTPNHEDIKPKTVNWRNFGVACELAIRAGATTAMLTGKGEPTLWPELISKHLAFLKGKFPLLELQTNGISISTDKIDRDVLFEWYLDGLTTVAISIAHWDSNRNSEIYSRNSHKHFEIADLIEKLHTLGFSVRLCAVLLKGWLDSPKSVQEMILHAKQWGVEQLTLTPVNAPAKSDRQDIVRWVEEHRLTTEMSQIHEHLRNIGDTIMCLPHGAEVFDYEGQNICLNNCLDTRPINGDHTIRNLVFHPDGHLRTDWQHSGSIIL